MAITTSAVCNVFKTDVLKGVHNFTNPGGNTFKLSMYTSSATLGKSTTSFTSDNQVTSPSGYSSGGKALVAVTPALSTDTAVVDFADLSFVGVTLTARGALIYNDTASGDPAVAVLDFGGDKTATSGTFTIQFPTADASSGILRLA
jgi:hypothetical protein|tara:strand:+ start:182 stop:619 length:438 start_codon:yes stop_codon:yes gene_type:complete